jgi:hypothetical protein
VGVTCKADNRAECERISRLRANHANNIEAILDDIGDTIEDINNRVEALGDDAREALIATVGDVSSIVFAGAAVLRAIRVGVAAVDAVITGGGAFAALFSLGNILSDYESRLSAFSRWREISHLRSSISSQRMDLNRSVRVLSDLNDEWERLGCGRRDYNDPR